jgi:hypothetical protein
MENMLKHLHSRDLFPMGVHRPMHISIDDVERIATFYLWNLSGQLVGYQQYRPDSDKKKKNDPKEGRYYTYSKDNIAVWGLESMFWRKDVLFLTEGVFDACKLHIVGLPAIAVLANDPKKIKSWLYALSHDRTIIAICDDDDAGRKLAKCAQMKLTPTGVKDLGEMDACLVFNWIKKELPWLW